jgi:hypothetical protein
MKGGAKLENRDLDGRIKMDVKEIGWEGLGCSYLTWDRDQWQAVVDIV